MDNATLCQICNREVTDDGNSCIACDLCDFWYHSKCVKIPKEVFKFLSEKNNESKYGSFQWSCPVCIQSGMSQPNFSNLQFNKLNATQMEQQQRITTLESHVSELLSAIKLNQDCTSCNLPLDLPANVTAAEKPTTEKNVTVNYAKAVIDGKKKVDVFKPNSERIRAKPTEIMFLKKNLNQHALDSRELKKTKDLLSKALEAVEVCFLKTNERSSDISIGFPNLSNKAEAEQCLQNLDLASLGYSASTKVKNLPKLTITHIPLDLLENDSNVKEKSDLENERACIKNCILQKSTEIMNLCNLGHTLDVIYLKKFDDSINIGIKVSPSIRDWILQRGFLFIGNTCCPAIDRLIVKQCFHCQKIGHVSRNCPSKSDPPICLYCMDAHRSATCPTKVNPTTYKCANCNNHRVYSMHSNHKSNSFDCPFIQLEFSKLQQNIEYSSKNAI